MFNLLQNDKSKGRQIVAAADSGDVFFAFDIGSSMVRLTAGQVKPDGTVRIVGYKEQPSAGVRFGSVVDIEKLSQNLAALTTAFQNEFGFNLGSCMIAAPGCFIDSDNVSGTSTVAGSGHTVQKENQLEAIQSARAGVRAFNETEYDIIHMIVKNYETETSSEIENPLGQYAKRLNVNVHVIGLKCSHEQNMNNVLKRLSADLSGSSFVYSGLAAADAVLTESQKEIGVCLVDIGGGSTNVVVYENKKLKMSFGLPRGGDVITQSLAKRFGISTYYAEMLKLQCGYANPMTIPDSQRGKDINVPSGDQMLLIPIEEVANVINNELKEIFHQVYDEVARRTRGTSLELGSGFVVTGGVANTRDLTSLFLQFQGGGMTKVSIGLPRGVESATEAEGLSFATPDKAVTVGLLREGYRQARENAQQLNAAAKPQHGMFGKLQALWKYFNSEFK